MSLGANSAQPRGPLARYQADVYSQGGEDGVIAEVLRRIGATADGDRWCAEVGAWDGVHWSNTARLIREDAYRAVLIEGDAGRAAALGEAHPGRNVVGIHALVTTNGSMGLDSLLAATDIPEEFDLLSIDIDGCDYYVWQAMRRYRPKVVVIEYNPTVPNPVVWVQPDDSGVQQGCSAAALVELGSRKGYALAAATMSNLIFVLADHAVAVLGDERLTLDDVRDDSGSRVFVFAGYDGSVHTSQPVELPWLGAVTVPSSRLQPLPAPLRHFYGGGGGWRRVRYGLAIAWISPAVLVRRLRRPPGKDRQEHQKD